MLYYKKVKREVDGDKIIHRSFTDEVRSRGKKLESIYWIGMTLINLLVMEFLLRGNHIVLEKKELVII